MIEPPPRTSHAAFHRRIGASDTRSGTQQWKQPDTLVEWGNNPDFWKDELPPNSKSLYIPFNGAKSGTAVSNSIKKMINDFELEGVKAEIGTSEDKAGGKVIPGMEILGPIFVSEKSKPDVIVTLPNNLVPLLFEVQSHAYEESIYQTASYLLDNFRLLRNLIQWKEWSAYLFPKPNEEGCVTRVDVTWIDEDLKFLLTYEPLSLDEYREDIRKKLNEQVEDVKQVGLTEKDWKLKLHCGIPLSEASLQHLAEVLKFGSWIDYEEKKSCEPSAQPRKPNEEDEADSVVKVEQWPSLSSIIVASNGHMYKHIIDPEERSKMAKFVNKGRDSDLCLLPIDFVDLTLSLSFLKYPVLDFPMTKAEVRKCFFHFAKGVSVALSCLHRRRHVAHLDVRLENVAFRRNRLNRDEYEAVLIDLDRHQGKGCLWSNKLYEAGSIMYSADPRFTTQMLDWRQLGIMLYFCHTDADSYKKLNIENMKKVKDPFIKELLRGNPDGEAKIETLTLRPEVRHMSISGVISERVRMAEDE